MEFQNAINFNDKTGFICDMDGVIYHGIRCCPGWLSLSSGFMMRTRNTYS